VHKQDTARLNAEAVSSLIREQGLKQYMLARSIGVEPLTVNRWLTGKVKRISRDNLARLASALGCQEEAISHADEADVRATQVEQSQAARMLVEQRAQNMFQISGDYELYEQLLKAVMHANMPLSDLCEIYNTLTKTCLRQRKVEDAREYNRLTLEYAQRCGNTDREFSALSNAAAIDGEFGQLVKARGQYSRARNLRNQPDACLPPPGGLARRNPRS
jgi:DNA-binding Xre family transcriptional regulator